MRWFDTENPSGDDTRIVRKFLLLPRNFNGENRWLEFANIIERYTVECHDEYIFRKPFEGWVEIGFGD